MEFIKKRLVFFRIALATGRLEILASPPRTGNARPKMVWQDTAGDVWYEQSSSSRREDSIGSEFRSETSWVRMDPSRLPDGEWWTLCSITLKNIASAEISVRLETMDREAVEFRLAPHEQYRRKNVVVGSGRINGVSLVLEEDTVIELQK